MSVADDSTEDHGHHLPAVEDWPKGFGEASWWPFITAIGVVGFYVGAALYIMGHGSNAMVSPTIGPLVFIGGAAVFLGGIYGWLYHAFIKHFWTRETSESGGHALRWGMLLFFGTEIATFGAGFVYYFFIRVGGWPPTGEAIPGLLTSVVLINTVLLVTSSITMHWAHDQLRRENRRNYMLGLGMTILLGISFLSGQVYEYLDYITKEGFTITSGLFGSAFFGLTGLHGLHVTLGVILLSIIFTRSLLGQFSGSRDVGVTTVTMYWHFIDAVWIFLVVVIYVGGSLS